MTSKQWLTIVGIFPFLNGAAALLVPNAFMSPFGVETDLGGILGLRYFGDSTLGLAVILWLARNLVDWDALRSVHVGGFVTFALALVVGASATISGVINALGWVNAAIDVVIVIGFAHFLFLKKAA